MNWPVFATSQTTLRRDAKMAKSCPAVVEEAMDAGNGYNPLSYTAMVAVVVRWSHERGTVLIRQPPLIRGVQLQTKDEQLHLCSPTRAQQPLVAFTG